MGIMFALGCLICSALNDFLFKVFSDKKTSTGVFVSVVGTVSFLALLTIPANWHCNLYTTLLWSAVSGFFSLTGNLLLIESMRYQSAGVCSTIYRLNLVAVVIGAVLLLGETMSFQQYIGVFSAVCAVFCFFSFDKNAAKDAKRGLIMALAASLLRAGMGLSCKYGITQGADTQIISIVTSFFWVFGGFAFCFIKKEPVKGAFNKFMLISGCISGLFVAGIIFFMNLALKFGDAGVVLTIAQMSFLATLFLSVIFLKEKLTRKKIAGMVCGIAAILLMSL